MTATASLTRTQVARRIRYAIVLTLREARDPMTVDALTKHLLGAGVPLGPKPNKRVADALRWEVKFKRAWKHGRGTYSYAGMPDSTRRWMTREAARIAPRLVETWATMRAAPPAMAFEARVARSIREAEEAFARHPERFAQTVQRNDDGAVWPDGGCSVTVGAIETVLRDCSAPPL